MAKKKTAKKTERRQTIQMVFLGCCIDGKSTIKSIWLELDKAKEIREREGKLSRYDPATRWYKKSTLPSHSPGSIYLVECHRAIKVDGKDADQIAVFPDTAIRIGVWGFDDDIKLWRADHDADLIERQRKIDLQKKDDDPIEKATLEEIAEIFSKLRTATKRAAFLASIIDRITH